MTYKGNKIRLDFNTVIPYTGRKCIIFKILRARKSEPNILHLAKLTLEYKGHRQPLIRMQEQY